MLHCGGAPKNKAPPPALDKNEMFFSASDSGRALARKKCGKAGQTRNGAAPHRLLLPPFTGLTAAGRAARAAGAGTTT